MNETFLVIIEVIVLQAVALAAAYVGFAFLERRRERLSTPIPLLSNSYASLSDRKLDGEGVIVISRMEDWPRADIPESEPQVIFLDLDVPKMSGSQKLELRSFTDSFDSVRGACAGLVLAKPKQRAKFDPASTHFVPEFA